MKYWEYGPLRVGGSGRYLENGEKPFFWMGDTAWLLFQQCTEEEARLYLKNRREKGFNVIQATLVHNMPGKFQSSLARVKRDVTTKEYWDHCEAITGLAEEAGLYMALLPTWGSIVKAGILHKENVAEYAEFLVRRFQKYPNIIWLLGGDIRGDVNPELYRMFGAILKEKMPRTLIGFHPFGRTSSSLWFHEEEWLDFNMFQSGHRRYDQAVLKQWDDVGEEFYGEDNWKYVNRDLAQGRQKPTVDGEPSYEWIPQGLHDPGEPFWQAWDVRRYAYWSVFQGAMGHTYGDNAIMQFYNDLSEPGNYGVREVWQEAVHHEGSSHMGHLAALMNSVDFTKGRAAEELLLSGQKEKYERTAVFAGPNYVFCYDYMGKEFTLDLTAYQSVNMSACWYDPTSGMYSYFGNTAGLEKITLKPPKRYCGQNDWVLVLREEAAAFDKKAVGGTKFIMVKGDITKDHGVQAVVNAANTSLLGGGGVDGAIHRAAGPELLAECRLLNGCRTGKAKLTKAYRLPCEYVIHTPGPHWNGGKSKEHELLASCYQSCLELAVENGIRTIAFPSISTGIYHFPVEEAAKTAIGTAKDFAARHPGKLDVIKWVLFDENTLQVYESELKRC